MMRTTTAVLAALICTTALPALADWQKMATIDVSGRRNQEFSMEEFKGNVIGLTAPGFDVACNRVAAVFANGDVRPLFRGVLRKGLGTRIDLPPGVVDRLTFDCHPMRGNEGQIDVAADTGVIFDKAHG
ncbi:MAG TPA: hypothetical protein VFW28_17215 [Micropepsaceae bacterium]|nr:hypothetical protein [Micropepsaceae bacterium]